MGKQLRLARSRQGERVYFTERTSEQSASGASEMSGWEVRLSVCVLKGGDFVVRVGVSRERKSARVVDGC